ncbi:MAG: hypothetical protein COA90_06615 [Gammaproteobacteria bacterium]|nr:MAG: hypothetical protein COA90_06615 [Gammaproteobacteria bacterium]
MSNLLALLSLSLISVAAIAADKADNTNELWKALDINTDGYISQEEAIKSQLLADNWEKIETSGDSAISVDEFTAFFAAPATEEK